MKPIDDTKNWPALDIEVAQLDTGEFLVKVIGYVVSDKPIYESYLLTEFKCDTKKEADVAAWALH